MTFEEFFIKKKIDLRQLQLAEPSLYKEFESHFELMGEKSFDHTKKYWFNRLRIQFHLAEDAIPVTSAKTPSTREQQPSSPSKIASTGKPLPEGVSASTAITPAAKLEETSVQKPAGFKPRFKPAATSLPAKSAEQEPEKLPDTDSSANTATGNNTPTGFKPRFKTGKTDTETTKKTESDGPAAQNPTSKPTGFKPRFKAGVTNKAASANQNNDAGSPDIKAETSNTDSGKDVNPTATSAPKPVGFKPRFKANITKESTPPEESKITEQANEELAGKEETTEKPKPLGFKPRFKAGVTDKNSSLKKDEPETVKEEPKVQTETTEEASNKSTATDDATEPKASNATKPTGFKPRFKPKNKPNE